MAKSKTAEKEPAPFPPAGDENKDPQQAAAEAKELGKSENEKALDASANARIASGGQSGAGSDIPARQGVGSVDDKTITEKELKSSKQPLAPEHPLEVPDKQEKKDEEKK